MSLLHHAAVVGRRFLVRHPWVHWAFVALVVVGSAASMLQRSDRVDRAREAWGAQRAVWVAVVDHAPGDPLVVERRDLPAAMLPAGAVAADGTAPQRWARGAIGAGEVVHDVDVVAADGPQALTPDGWLGVPVVESPASGALIGDRVHVVSDGVVVSSEAIVVGHHDDVTVVAVPAEVAPLVPAAAEARSLTLLLVP